MVFETLEYLLVAIVLTFSIFLTRRMKGDSKYIPGPMSLPILGNLHQLGRDPLTKLHKWAKKYGPLYAIKMGSDTTIIISDHKLVKELFSDPATAGRDVDNTVFSALSSNSGIAMAEGVNWEEQRRFTIRKLKDMGLLKRSIESRILVEVEVLLQVLRRNAGNPVPEKGMFNGAVVNTVWGIVSGERQEWDAPVQPEILKITDNMVASLNRMTSTGLLFAPFLKHLAPKYTGWIDWTNEIANFQKLMDTTIEKNIKNHKSDNPQDYNFMDHYLERIRMEDDPTSSFYKETGEDNFKTVIVELFMAGAESSSLALCWAMLWLSQKQDIQRKLQFELDKVLGPPGSRLPSCADRTLLPFTEAVILENHRISPVDPLGVPHKMLNDMEFHGHLLKKGFTLWSNIYGIHHDPNVWGKDVEEFKPERFLSEDGTKVIRHEALLPFSVGRRQCPGEPLAKDTLLLFLSSIFHNFNVEPDPSCLKADMTPVLGMALKPKPFKLVFKGREKVV